MNLEFLNLMVVHFLHALFLFFLMDWRFTKKTVVLILAIDYLFNVAISLALLMYAPIGVTAFFTFLLVVGVHVAVCLWAGAGQPGKKIFLVASYYIFFYCVIIIADWISILFGKNEAIAEIFLKIPFFVLAIVFWVVKGKSYIEEISHGITRGWRTLALFALSLMLGVAILTVLVYPPMRVNTDNLNILRTLAFMLVVLSSYATLLQTIKGMNERFDESQFRSLHWLLESELSAEKASVAQAMQYRHDMRHHNQLLLSLAKEGNLEKIRAYLAEYDETLENASLPSFCAHTVANALLCNFARKCENLGISYEIRCQIPASLPISDVEVCSVFGNLLENALDSLQKCTEKSFSLVAQVADGNLCVQVRNSVHGTVRFKDGFPLTTKKNGGVGTKSIANTLALHAGLVEFSQIGSEFLTQIILPL